MKETQAWTWRFSHEGRLEYGQCTTTVEWRKQRTAGWKQISPACVAKRMHMLAEVYQQPNLYLIYRVRHPAPEHCMEPEYFQILFKGLGEPLAYTPRAISDIATAFVLPPSFFLLRRVSVVPRPFDGARRRWDRMATIRPTAVKAQAEQAESRRTPTPGTNILSVGRGDGVAAVEAARLEGEPFLHFHKTPRLYCIEYQLIDESHLMIVVEASKKQANAAFTALHPDGEINSITSALALPGLALDLPRTCSEGQSVVRACPAAPGIRES